MYFSLSLPVKVFHLSKIISFYKQENFEKTQKFKHLKNIQILESTAHFEWMPICECHKTVYEIDLCTSFTIKPFFCGFKWPLFIQYTFTMFVHWYNQQSLITHIYINHFSLNVDLHRKKSGVDNLIELRGSNQTCSRSFLIFFLFPESFQSTADSVFHIPRKKTFFFRRRCGLRCGHLFFSSRQIFLNPACRRIFHLPWVDPFARFVWIDLFFISASRIEKELSDGWIDPSTLGVAS